MAKPDPTPSKPWWNYPHMWLVVGGPLVVVVAAIVTAVIALSAPDPLIAEDYYKKGLEINTTLTEQDRNMVPALQARNHAVTPVAPQNAASSAAPGAAPGKP